MVCVRAPAPLCIGVCASVRESIEAGTQKKNSKINSLPAEQPLPSVGSGSFYRAVVGSRSKNCIKNILNCLLDKIHANLFDIH